MSGTQKTSSLSGVSEEGKNEISEGVFVLTVAWILVVDKPNLSPSRAKQFSPIFQRKDFRLALSLIGNGDSFMSQGSVY